MSGYGNDPASPPPNDPLPYGSMPPPSEAERRAGASIPTGPIPVSVDRASKLLYAIAAWGVLSALISLLDRDAIRDAIRDADTTLSESDVNAAMNVALAFTIVIALAFGALYFLCGSKMRVGRNWARITPTVLIGLGVIFGLINIGRSGGLSVALQVISLILGIAFLFFAWSKPSNEFFAAHKVRR